MAYSKNRVDKAGRLFADEMQRGAEDKRRVGDHRAELEESVEVIEWWRGEHAGPLLAVAADLHRYTANEGKPVVAQRLKKWQTIAAKLMRESSMKLSRMEDIGGARAVLPNQEVAYRIANRLQNDWAVTRFRDYVATPKTDGYRALHLITRRDGRLIEVQLRTPRQDTWANTVEDFGRAFPGLKSGEGPPLLHDYFQVIAEIWALEEGGLGTNSSLMRKFREMQPRVDTLIDELLDDA